MTHHTGDQKEVNCSEILLSVLMSKRLNYDEWKHDPTCMKFYKFHVKRSSICCPQGVWTEVIGTRHEEIFWGDVNILQPGRFGLNSCMHLSDLNKCPC